MALLELTLITILITLLIITISALPLHLAVSFLGGRSSIFKAFLVMIVTGIVIVVITPFFSFGRIIAFILLIWIYREMFRLKWYKAFFAWILQMIFIFLIGFVLSAIGLGMLIF